MAHWLLLLHLLPMPLKRQRGLNLCHSPTPDPQTFTPLVPKLPTSMTALSWDNISIHPAHRVNCLLD